jgi:hypothetical protein
MVKDTLLALLFAMKIEFGMVLLFSVAYGLGFRIKISRHWLVRISIGWVAITTITFLIFTYVAYSNGMIRQS